MSDYFHSGLFHTGLVAPLDKANVDTDQIIPKQFLTSVSRDGFGEALFYDWRYRKDGSANPEFILNRPEYNGASVLVSQDNFGCGSSREHAPWALKQYGFEVIVAPSFADIFFGNCVNNQMLAITLAPEHINQLILLATEFAPAHVHVDMNSNQLICQPKGQKQQSWPFVLSADVKARLLAGLDFIDVTLQHVSEIEAFERRRVSTQPWL